MLNKAAYLALMQGFGARCSPNRESFAFICADISWTAAAIYSYAKLMPDGITPLLFGGLQDLIPHFCVQVGLSQRGAPLIKMQVFHWSTSEPCQS